MPIGQQANKQANKQIIMISLHSVSTRLTPALRQSIGAIATTANANVFARALTSSTTTNTKAVWSDSLSFAGPESDFVSQTSSRTFTSVATANAANQWSESLSYASPESDFVSQPLSRNFTSATKPDAYKWSQTLSFASPESDFSVALENAQFAPGHERPLPLTWSEALHMDKEAIVITTSHPPHRVVHVNAAWENLCGYTKSEALHKPIGPLLQQGEHKSHTNLAARHLIHQLEADHYTVEHDAYLENFTKSGRPFLNHLRVGPLYMEQDAALQHGEPDFLIGVLQEVQRKDVPLRMVV